MSMGNYTEVFSNIPSLPSKTAAAARYVRVPTCTLVPVKDVTVGRYSIL